MNLQDKEKDYKNYLTIPIREDRKPLHELLPLKQPLRLLIDPCDACNFKCNFCFQSKDGFIGTKMTRETFNLILKQLKEFDEPINIIHMYGLGEPLINQDLPDFISLIKKNNLAKEIAITTNGSLLKEELSRKLVASGLDRLSISLNGIQDEHYKKIAGTNVNFKEIYKEIKFFYSIRGNCHLHVKINGDCFNEEELKKFVYLFKDYTDSLNIDNIVNVWPGIEVTNSKNRMYNYDIEKLENEGQEKKAVCPLMFYELVVHSDGSVSPCAVDYRYKSENLGNIRELSIKEIWDGYRLLEIRRQALKGQKIDYKICENCQYTECAATVNITPFREELLKRYSKG